MLNGQGMRMQSQFDNSGSLVNYYAGQQSSAVTLTANTGPATNSLGGLFTLPSSITPGLSDYPLFAYQIPYSTGSNPNTNTRQHKSFIVTGVRICELYIATALTGGPLVFQWGIAYGGGSAATIASLNFNDSGNWVGQANEIGVPIGYQTLAASSAVGTISQAIDVSFAEAPLVTHPQEYVKIILRVPSGTAISAGEIRGAVQIRGYWV
jgi:hypothetical protein